MREKSIIDKRKSNTGNVPPMPQPAFKSQVSMLNRGFTRMATRNVKNGGKDELDPDAPEQPHPPAPVRLEHQFSRLATSFIAPVGQKFVVKKTFKGDVENPFNKSAPSTYNENQYLP